MRAPTRNGAITGRANQKTIAARIARPMTRRAGRWNCGSTVRASVIGGARSGGVASRVGLQLGRRREGRPTAPREFQQDPGEWDRHETVVEAVQEHARGDGALILLARDG